LGQGGGERRKLVTTRTRKPAQKPRSRRPSPGRGRLEIGGVTIKRHTEESDELGKGSQKKTLDLKDTLTTAEREGYTERREKFPAILNEGETSHGRKRAHSAFMT